MFSFWSTWKKVALDTCWLIQETEALQYFSVIRLGALVASLYGDMAQVMFNLYNTFATVNWRLHQPLENLVEITYLTGQGG